ncbi:hypothetical protein B0H66DRAFT_633350 [Apodospora peruviana]|uniref:Uncharacterized protein n=1 Tax=Apodospora peruviana TaxID=516989 RepID=A0AAE0HTD2_9PEZI|nr:hypothetical protein B0H66DRAFT_633350 [Apodospora peruviana]
MAVNMPSAGVRDMGESPASASSAFGFRRLPTELVDMIFENLRPKGPVTTHGSNGELPRRNIDHFNSRTSFHSLSRTSRNLHHLATRFLYRWVLLRNQDELLCFFRTMINRADFRILVRSFSWVGLLLGNNQPHRGVYLSFMPSYCWAEIQKWPSPCGSMDRDPLVLDSGTVLGGVLAMISGVKSLFILLGGCLCHESYSIPLPLIPSYPEGGVLWKKVAPAEFPVDLVARNGANGRFRIQYCPHDNDSPTGPQQHAFLSEVEQITLELPPGGITRAMTYQKPHQHFVCCGPLHSFLLTLPSPGLRRLEIKGQAQVSCASRTITTKNIINKVINFINNDNNDSNDKEPLDGAVVGPMILPTVRENVKELVRLQMKPADFMMYPPFPFPHLISLTFEFRSFDGVPSALFDRTLAKLLRRLSGTLERLSLTTSSSHGDWLSRHRDGPLVSDLSGMTRLRSLTVEAFWLFGTDSRKILPNVFQLAQRLPPSLVRLEFIDFGAMRGTRLWEPFSPFPGEFLDLYTQILTVMHNECCHGSAIAGFVGANRTYLANLEEIRLAANLSCYHRPPRPIPQDECYALASNFTEQFAAVGVRFSLVDRSVAAFERYEASWANVS